MITWEALGAMVGTTVAVATGMILLVYAVFVVAGRFERGTEPPEESEHPAEPTRCEHGVIHAETVGPADPVTEVIFNEIVEGLKK